MNIAYTVQPSNQPSQMEWEKEFKVGTLAPKSREGRDRANAMMKLWEDKNQHIDFTQTIKKLSHDETNR
jgi:hypothetical protein